MNKTEKIFFSFTILLLCCAAYIQIYMGYAGDKNWLLLYTQMMLNGRELYVDLFQPNLPLIFWFYAIPVWISRHIPGLADYQALALTGLAIAAACIWLSVYLIKQHSEFKENRRQQALFALLLAYLLVFFSSPVCFFDREHFMLVLILPYIFRHMPGLANANTSLRIRLLIGFLAAVGFCIKPHTVIIFGMLQLLVIIRTRSFAILRSIENCIIYSIALLYLFYIWRFMPEYFGIIMPMALSTYSGVNQREYSLVYISLAATSAGLTFVDFRPRYATPYRRDIYYFIGVALAFAIYALTNNGWAYTYNPLFCMLLFLSVWVWWEFRWLKSAYEQQNQDVRTFIFGARDCMVSLCAATGYIIYIYIKILVFIPCDAAQGCQAKQPFIEYVKSHHVHSFGAMTLDFDKWTVLSRLTGASWDTRFNHLWMVPKLVMSSRDFVARNYWIIKYVGRAYAEDLTRRKPEIVIVDSGRLLKGYDLNIPDFLSVIPEFKEAWSHYQYAETINECDDYNTDNNMNNNNNAWGAPVQYKCSFDIFTVAQ